MKLFLPKQHGAWAMLIIPFWLGVAATKFLWQHIPFFIGWLLLYLATYPMLLLVKRKKIPFYLKWTFIYLVPALLFLLIPLLSQPKLMYFGLLMLPFFMINAYYSHYNQDRAFGNDVSAVIAFSIAGIGSGFLVTEQLTNELILVFMTSILFFLGCTFYVKTMIREKKNIPFKWVSWAFHLMIPIGWIILGEGLIAFAFLPSLVRAIAFYGKPLSAKQVGVYEIANSILFFIPLLIRFV
ncbi:YwiC-like family protein [Pseudoneobacillus sp. C159]